MPTYEFTCPNGHDFDKFFRSMASAPKVVDCPVCGQPADRQMSAGAGLVFHGTGFYITDYGKDGKKDQKSAVRSSESTRKANAESKSADSSDSSSGPAEAKSEAGSSESSSSADTKSAGDSSPPKAADAPAPKPASTPKASE